MQQPQTFKGTVSEKAIQRASELLIKYELPAKDVTDMLVNEESVDPDDAKRIVSAILKKAGPVLSAPKRDANKDIIWGSIWTVGGTVLTFANIGYIFWGAIVFGGFQLVRGIANKINS